MKILTVRHATTYRYKRPVTFGQHRLMLRPRDSHDMRLVSAELTLSPPGNTRWLHDVFGNSVALVDFSGPASMLTISSVLEIVRNAAGAVKFTSATELPNTSCSQRVLPGGDSVSSAETRRMSCESRGRSISRC